MNTKNLLLSAVITVLLIVFAAGLVWFANGSCEMFPTDEQQEKARIGALIVILLSVVPCAVCIVSRIKGNNK